MRKYIGIVKSLLIPKALRGLFWAILDFVHSPLCKFYFDFTKIYNVGGECD